MGELVSAAASEHPRPCPLPSLGSSAVRSALRVGARLRCSYHAYPAHAPFGGYKQSGNGREWGSIGMEDFLETKAIMGAPTS